MVTKFGCQNQHTGFEIPLNASIIVLVFFFITIRLFFSIVNFSEQRILLEYKLLALFLVSGFRPKQEKSRPTIMKISTCRYENLDSSSWKCKPVIMKISTSHCEYIACHQEILDFSLWKSGLFKWNLDFWTKLRSV